MKNINSEKVAKKNKMAVLAVAIAVVIIAIVICVLIFTMGKGNSEKSIFVKKADPKQVKAAYTEYLSNVFVPKIGLYDPNSAEKNGVHSALCKDLNNDGTDELVVAASFYDEIAGNFKISCYKYDNSAKAKDKSPVKSAGKVEPNITWNTENFNTNERIMYSVEFKGKTYIVYESFYWSSYSDYQAHIFEYKNGKLTEVSNIYVPHVGDSYNAYSYSEKLPEKMKIDNSDFKYDDFKGVDWLKDHIDEEEIILLYYDEIGRSDKKYDSHFKSIDESVSAFFKYYGIERKGYAQWSNKDGVDNISIVRPEKADYIFTENRHFEYSFDDKPDTMVYDFKDYTDFKSLFNVDDSKKESVDEKKNTTKNEAAYKEYAKIYSDALKEYGNMWINYKDIYSAYPFVNYAELIDFNNDGTDEFYIVYYLGEKIKHKCYFDVWGYNKDGKIKKLDSGNLYFSDGGQNNICMVEHNGMKYIKTDGNSSCDSGNFHGFVGDEFKIAKSFDEIYDKKNEKTKYMIDGKEHTYDEYIKNLTEWDDGIIKWYGAGPDLYVNDNDESMFDIINRTKSALGIKPDSEQESFSENGEVKLYGKIIPLHYENSDKGTTNNIIVLKLPSEMQLEVSGTSENSNATIKSDYIQIEADSGNDFESIDDLLCRTVVVKGKIKSKSNISKCPMKSVLYAEEVEIIS